MDNEQEEIAGLTEREQKEVALALVYHMAFRHGTAGHGTYTALAKVAQQNGYAVILDDPYNPRLRHNTGVISDGYHTFNDLYEHRCLLFVYLMNVQRASAFKTRKHKDGTQYEGWFVGIIRTVQGDISYHLPDELWGVCMVPEIERYADFDGHTSTEVVQRLRAIAEEYADAFSPQGANDGSTSS